MKLTDLSKKQMVALALQFKVLGSVSEAAAKSALELALILDKPEIVALVEEVP